MVQIHLDSFWFLNDLLVQQLSDGDLSQIQMQVSVLLLDPLPCKPAVLQHCTRGIIYYSCFTLQPPSLCSLPM